MNRNIIAFILVASLDIFVPDAPAVAEDNLEITPMSFEKVRLDNVFWKTCIQVVNEETVLFAMEHG